MTSLKGGLAAMKHDAEWTRPGDWDVYVAFVRATANEQPVDPTEQSKCVAAMKRMGLEYADYEKDVKAIHALRGEVEDLRRLQEEERALGNEGDVVRRLAEIDEDLAARVDDLLRTKQNHLNRLRAIRETRRARESRQWSISAAERGLRINQPHPPTKDDHD